MEIKRCSVFVVDLFFEHIHNTLVSWFSFSAHLYEGGEGIDTK